MSFLFYLPAYGSGKLKHSCGKPSFCNFASTSLLMMNFLAHIASSFLESIWRQSFVTSLGIERETSSQATTVCGFLGCSSTSPMISAMITNPRHNLYKYFYSIQVLSIQLIVLEGFNPHDTSLQREFHTLQKYTITSLLIFNSK